MWESDGEGGIGMRRLGLELTTGLLPHTALGVRPGFRNSGQSAGAAHFETHPFDERCLLLTIAVSG